MIILLMRCLSAVVIVFGYLRAESLKFSFTKIPKRNISHDGLIARMPPTWYLSLRTALVILNILLFHMNFMLLLCLWRMTLTL